MTTITEGDIRMALILPLGERLTIDDVILELMSARRKFRAFTSAHEAYAVILEELDELWDVIKEN